MHSNLMKILLSVLSLSLFAVLGLANTPGAAGSPSCPDPINAHFIGNCVENCTSVQQTMGLDHVEEYLPSYDMVATNGGATLSVNGTPSTGKSGTQRVNVPPGKKICFRYNFTCCPKPGGNVACSIKSVRLTEDDADCDDSGN